MYKPVHAIEVRIWGKTVGAVALDPRLGYYAFEYDPAFATTIPKISPLVHPDQIWAQGLLFAGKTGDGWLRVWH